MKQSSWEKNNSSHENITNLHQFLILCNDLISYSKTINKKTAELHSLLYRNMCYKLLQSLSFPLFSGCLDCLVFFFY